jgi:hypothetical protein
MLQRLGATAKMGQDWFTKYTLAEALHIRAENAQKWIDRGWLQCRTVQPQADETDYLRRTPSVHLNNTGQRFLTRLNLTGSVLYKLCFP